jgi:hypothetical protein
VTANFDEAEIGGDAWVYCTPDDEDGWVVSPEWFDDIDEPETIKRQRWVLVEEQTVIFHPQHELCPDCNGEGEITLPPVSWTGEDVDGHPVTCGTCDGDGGHPLAGQMEIVSSSMKPSTPRPSTSRRSGG